MSIITPDYTDVPVSQPLPMSTQQGADIWYEAGITPPEGRYDVWMRIGEIDKFHDGIDYDYRGKWVLPYDTGKVTAWRRRRFFTALPTKAPWLSGTGRLPDDDGWYRGSLQPPIACDYEAWIAGSDGGALHVHLCHWSVPAMRWDMLNGVGNLLAWRYNYKKSLLLTMPEWVANYRPEPDAAGWLPGYVLPPYGDTYDVYLVVGDTSIHIPEVTYTKDRGWMGLPDGARNVNAWRPTRDRAKPAWLP